MFVKPYLKIKTSTLNIGKISFFLLHSRTYIVTIINDKTITLMIPNTILT